MPISQPEIRKNRKNYQNFLRISFVYRFWLGHVETIASACFLADSEVLQKSGDYC